MSFTTAPLRNVRVTVHPLRSTEPFSAQVSAREAMQAASSSEAACRVMYSGSPKSFFSVSRSFLSERQMSSSKSSLK